MYYNEDTTIPLYLDSGTTRIRLKRSWYSTGTSTVTPIYEDSYDTSTPCYFETNYDTEWYQADEEIMKPRYRPPRYVIKSIAPRKKFLISTRIIRIGREKYPSGKNFCKSPSRSCRQLKIRI